MPIHKYRRVTTPGPNGSTLYFRNAEVEPRATELAEVDGWHYVYIPDAAQLPAQHTEIGLQPVVPDDVLKGRIKDASRAVQLIFDEMQKRIRAKYSVEDEQYFARIGVGVALGAYVFGPGENTELLAFGAHVEAARQWGRAKRAEIGL